MTYPARFGAPADPIDDECDDDFWQPGLWSEWRWPAAVGALAAALAHLPIMGDHVQEAPYVGLLLAALALVGLGLAAALLIADTAVRYVLLGAWSLLAVLAYAATRLVATAQVERGAGDGIYPWAFAAVAAELTVAACCAAAVRRRTDDQ